MAYKRYIKRGRKWCGPYLYSSKRQGGTVRSIYLGLARIGFSVGRGGLGEKVGDKDAKRYREVKQYKGSGNLEPVYGMDKGNIEEYQRKVAKKFASESEVEGYPKRKIPKYFTPLEYVKPVTRESTIVGGSLTRDDVIAKERTRAESARIIREAQGLEKRGFKWNGKTYVKYDEEDEVGRAIREYGNENYHKGMVATPISELQAIKSNYPIGSTEYRKAALALENAAQSRIAIDNTRVSKAAKDIELDERRLKYLEAQLDPDVLAGQREEYARIASGSVGIGEEDIKKGSNTKRALSKELGELKSAMTEEKLDKFLVNSGKVDARIKNLQDELKAEDDVDEKKKIRNSLNELQGKKRIIDNSPLMKRANEINRRIDSIESERSELDESLTKRRGLLGESKKLISKAPLTDAEEDKLLGKWTNITYKRIGRENKIKQLESQFGRAQGEEQKDELRNDISKLKDAVEKDRSDERYLEATLKARAAQFEVDVDGKTKADLEKKLKDAKNADDVKRIESDLKEIKKKTEERRKSVMARQKVLRGRISDNAAILEYDGVPDKIDRRRLTSDELKKLGIGEAKHLKKSRMNRKMIVETIGIAQVEGGLQKHLDNLVDVKKANTYEIKKLEEREKDLLKQVPMTRKSGPKSSKLDKDLAKTLADMRGEHGPVKPTKKGRMPTMAEERKLRLSEVRSELAERREQVETINKRMKKIDWDGDGSANAPSVMTLPDEFIEEYQIVENQGPFLKSGAGAMRKDAIDYIPTYAAKHVNDKNPRVRKDARRLLERYKVEIKSSRIDPPKPEVAKAKDKRKRGTGRGIYTRKQLRTANVEEDDKFARHVLEDKKAALTGKQTQRWNKRQYISGLMREIKKSGKGSPEVLDYKDKVKKQQVPVNLMRQWESEKGLNDVDVLEKKLGKSSESAISKAQKKTKESIPTARRKMFIARREAAAAKIVESEEKVNFYMKADKPASIKKQNNSIRKDAESIVKGSNIPWEGVVKVSRGKLAIDKAAQREYFGKGIQKQKSKNKISKGHRKNIRGHGEEDELGALHEELEKADIRHAKAEKRKGANKVDKKISPLTVEVAKWREKSAYSGGYRSIERMSNKELKSLNPKLFELASNSVGEDNARYILGGDKTGRLVINKRAWNEFPKDRRPIETPRGTFVKRAAPVMPTALDKSGKVKFTEGAPIQGGKLTTPRLPKKTMEEEHMEKQEETKKKRREADSKREVKKQPETVVDTPPRGKRSMLLPFTKKDPLTKKTVNSQRNVHVTNKVYQEAVKAVGKKNASMVLRADNKGRGTIDTSTLSKVKKALVDKKTGKVDKNREVVYKSSTKRYVTAKEFSVRKYYTGEDLIRRQDNVPTNSAEHKAINNVLVDEGLARRNPDDTLVYVGGTHWSKKIPKKRLDRAVDEEDMIKKVTS